MFGGWYPIRELKVKQIQDWMAMRFHSWFQNHDFSLCTKKNTSFNFVLYSRSGAIRNQWLVWVFAKYHPKWSTMGVFWPKYTVGGEIEDLGFFQSEKWASNWWICKEFLKDLFVEISWRDQKKLKQIHELRGVAQYFPSISHTGFAMNVRYSFIDVYQGLKKLMKFIHLLLWC